MVSRKAKRREKQFALDVPKRSWEAIIAESRSFFSCLGGQISHGKSHPAEIEQAQIRTAFGDGRSGHIASTGHEPSGQDWRQFRAPAGPNLYEQIGVRPLINAKGTYTIISGSLSLPEVKQAMDEAGRHYVNMDELMAAVGARLAKITGAEWGIVTAGCAAAITGATAACIAGTDPEKSQKMPYMVKGGLKSQVIIPKHSRNPYDVGSRLLGVDVVEVETPEQLEASMGPQTAMIYILSSPCRSNRPAEHCEYMPGRQVEKRSCLCRRRSRKSHHPQHSSCGRRNLCWI